MKVKELWYFAKWQYSKWSWAQKVWLLGCVFMGSSLAADHSQGLMPWQFKVGTALWVLSLGYGLIWEVIILGQWAAYKREQRKMLDDIKGK